ncbi:MAG: hypothetical protein KA408_06440 [Flavobacteriales bacterium]|nr:hypothetical protein [Flavobacteriales bacterium]
MILWSGVLLTGSNAQDLIVRLNGDSVNCKITGSDKEGLHYSYLYDSKRVSSYAPFTTLKNYQKRYYDTSFSGDLRRRDIRSHPIFRVAMLGAFGYHIGKIDDRLPQWAQEHNRRLRVATGVFGEVHIMASSSIGVGLLIGMVNSSSSTQAVTFLMEDGTTQIGLVKDDIVVKYYGPSVLYCGPLGEGLNVSGSLSGGVLDYRNRAVVLEPITVRGRTYGVRLGCALEYRSNIGLGMGLFASATRATLQNLNIEGDPIGRELLNYGEFIDLSRIDVGACVSYVL